LFSGLRFIVLLFGVLFSQQIKEDLVRAATSPSVKKADFSKGYQNPNRKLGVTTHFSEIIELKF